MRKVTIVKSDKIRRKSHLSSFHILSLVLLRRQSDWLGMILRIAKDKKDYEGIKFLSKETAEQNGIRNSNFARKNKQELLHNKVNGNPYGNGVEDKE
ncbi:hypothetical protein KQX54_008316 [Cotesia glomerata]|uniref:Uncharacterized protein n=1 Tax=Cotesia glomerata TaxID=32391 RepID=A0AAV7IPK6_COTGL|nr:hypothetical protein KQX54_008316 [Cotesia glomerata]